MTKEKEIAVVITTAHRGVFFGYTKDKPAKEKMVLRSARNCIYWPSSNRGFMGLAEIGPADGARVGPKADITVFDITSVMVCTQEAIKKWEAAPWSRS